jgi:hypothetical protein
VSSLSDPRSDLTFEVDELTELTCQFEYVDDLPDRPPELRNVVRLGPLDSVQGCTEEAVVEYLSDTVPVARLPDAQRRGA